MLRTMARYVHPNSERLAWTRQVVLLCDYYYTCFDIIQQDLTEYNTRG